VVAAGWKRWHERLNGRKQALTGASVRCSSSGGDLIFDGDARAAELVLSQAMHHTARKGRTLTGSSAVRGGGTKDTLCT
jgi:hypothetical protein